MKTAAITVLGVFLASAMTVFGWMITDLNASSKKNVEQDVILKYTNEHIEAIQQDLRDIKVHFLRQGK